jgi:hypothetical protein
MPMSDTAATDTRWDITPGSARGVTAATPSTYGLRDLVPGQPRSTAGPECRAPLDQAARPPATLELEAIQTSLQTCVERTCGPGLDYAIRIQIPPASAHECGQPPPDQIIVLLAAAAAKRAGFTRALALRPVPGARRCVRGPPAGLPWTPVPAREPECSRRLGRRHWSGCNACPGVRVLRVPSTRR